MLRDLTGDSRRRPSEGWIDAVIGQQVDMIGEQAVLRLLGAIVAGRMYLPLHHIEPRIALSKDTPRDLMNA